jgi:uncharacterized membrane protein
MNHLNAPETLAAPPNRFTKPLHRPYVSGVIAPSAQHADTAAPLGGLFFERVLSPHRSLPPHGFHILMLALGLVSLAIGIAFISIGAWPVIGFFGLDVALVYVAFRLSYRSARRSETIRLADDAFTVEQVSVRGASRIWRFQPFWLRVILEERADKPNRLLVASHGRSLAIGDFVTPSARVELAETIRDALKRWRDALNPATVAPDQSPSTSFNP